jgi:hypothetical protein
MKNGEYSHGNGPHFETIWIATFRNSAGMMIKVEAIVKPL